MTRTNSYIPTLDGWRALSIAAVMFSHMPFVHSHWLLSLQTRGGLGVSVFFVISGYLICTRLMQEEHQYGRISLARFYMRRLFRIQPAAIVFLVTLVILFYLHFIPLDFRAWKWSLFSIRNYYSETMLEKSGTAYTNHFWSLGVEEQFYFVVPCLLFFIPKPSRLTWLTVIFIISFIFARYCWYRGFSGVQTGSSFEELMLPSVIAVMLFEKPALKSYITETTVLATIVMLCLGIANRKLHGMATDPMIHMLILVSVLGTSLLPASLPSRVLEFAPIRFIGKISYSLYLWQQLFCIRMNLSGASLGFQKLQARPISFVYAFICAITSYYIIERPLIRVGHRVASRSRSSLK